MAITLIIINILIVIAFICIMCRMKISVTTVFLSTFIVCSVFGFLLIGYDTNGIIWDYFTDYSKYFAFSLGTGIPQLHFITLVNVGVLLGSYLALIIPSKNLIFASSLAQIPLKGAMTFLFGLGGGSCIVLFFIFYLYFFKGWGDFMFNILHSKKDNQNYKKLFTFYYKYKVLKN